MNRTNVSITTLVELLVWRAIQQPEHRIFTYLTDGETEGAHLTFGALDSQARAIGALLQSYEISGARALLLYPAGLEFIAAFFGCLYAGVIAVPLPPPNMAQPQRSLPRLRTIVSDAQPELVVTTSSLLAKAGGLFAHAPELETMRWLPTDKVAESAANEWRNPDATGKSLALLQYTSGSTALPRGVMVSHENLLENSAHVRKAFELTSDTLSVTWLPVFHDMGLTNGIVQPVFGGRQCVLMSPQSFLQRPARWLQAISRYRASVSGGPNFAYEMCTRKISPEQRSALDLSSWNVAFNGAEPVRADTLRRFAATFESCGFQPKFFYPCFGLAEATLIVAGGRVQDEPILCTTDVTALEHGRASETSVKHSNVRTLVGCGQAMAGTKILIVHPELLTACADDEVGEIWVSGSSVTQGYWNRPEETAHTFGGYLADTGEGPFLRTGDLGFLREGELFVTGRLKDLIIIGGRNLYPHDIELTVEQSDALVRPGGCVAFAAEVADEERLIIAMEVERRYRTSDRSLERTEAGRNPRQSPPLDAEAMSRTVRQAVAEAHDIRVHEVVILAVGTLPKTPSGKIQRRVCEARYRDGTLERSARAEQ